jgi:hypothetical protein
MSVKKSSQLGMNFSKASHLLKRRILFRFLERLGETKCYRCSEEMTYDSFSVDHVKDWLDRDPLLFWDLDNIKFSHKKCNIRSSRKTSTCKTCGKSEPEVTIRKWNRVCTDCKNSRKRVPKMTR